MFSIFKCHIKVKKKKDIKNGYSNQCNGLKNNILIT